jgi:hypothetical protein
MLFYSCFFFAQSIPVSVRWRGDEIDPRELKLQHVLCSFVMSSYAEMSVGCPRTHDRKVAVATGLSSRRR